MLLDLWPQLLDAHPFSPGQRKSLRQLRRRPPAAITGTTTVRLRVVLSGYGSVESTSMPAVTLDGTGTVQFSSATHLRVATRHLLSGSSELELRTSSRGHREHTRASRERASRDDDLILALIRGAP